MTDRVFSFEPVWARDARVLILGTMPSVASLQQGFYYAHPRNAFWPLMFELLGEAATSDLEEKKRLLLRNRIALWDVAFSCVRPGSMDSAIREAQPNDIPGLIRKCPEMRLLLLNGTAAFTLCGRLFKTLPVERAILPSTSPANTMPYEKKRDAWAARIPQRRGYEETVF